MIIERTDFVSVPVTDLERSVNWYRETLGLEQTGEGAWPEFRLGENAFLYLMDPTNIGREFQGPHTAPIALRVPDVEAARADLVDRGIAFHGDTFDTGVCHMAHFTDPDGNVLLGAGVSDPAGNRILLHRRYAPYPDGTTP